MWATLALASVLQLTPAQAGALSFKNVRATYGVIGPTRASEKLLPGDVYVASFDIDGLEMKKDGRVGYSMGMEFLKPDGKPLFKRDPTDFEAYNPLGTGRIPAYAAVQVPLDAAAGEYTLKVTVGDRATKKTEVLTRKFDVLPKTFGIVAFQITSLTGEAAPPLAVPGQGFYFNVVVVGFTEDPKKPTVIPIEMRIFDEAGKPTLEEPYKGEAKTHPEDEVKGRAGCPLQFKPNRAGKFKVEIKATDPNNKDKATATHTFEFVIIEQK